MSKRGVLAWQALVAGGKWEDAAARETPLFFVWIFTFHVCVAGLVYWYGWATWATSNHTISYPVIVEKHVSDQGWKFDTTAGRIDVPFVVYERHKVGDRIQVEAYPSEHKVFCGEECGG